MGGQRVVNTCSALGLISLRAWYLVEVWGKDLVEAFVTGDFELLCMVCVHQTGAVRRAAMQVC